MVRPTTSAQVSRVLRFATEHRIPVTARGAALRQRIEDETDRLFFAPWPDQLGGKADWIARKLSEVNAALA